MWDLLLGPRGGKESIGHVLWARGWVYGGTGDNNSKRGDGWRHINSFKA